MHPLRRFAVSSLTLLACLALVYFFRIDVARFLLKVPDISHVVRDAASGFALERFEKEISAPPPLYIEREEVLSALTRAGTIAMTNRARAEQELPPLSENVKLNAAAMAKAEDILARQYFAHESPIGEGPGTLVEREGYEFIVVGENLALGHFADDADLVEAWMESPGHRANILNQKYTEIGVAVKEGKYEGKSAWVAVQEFALPSSACPAVDASLKAMIDMESAQLEGYQAEIESLKGQIHSGGIQRVRELRDMIERYNELVAQHNALLAEAQASVAAYNEQVQAHNACIGDAG